MSDKLKPCPFCGETEDIYLREKKYYGPADELVGKQYLFVQCYMCGIRTEACWEESAVIEGYKDARHEAIDAWNRRQVSDDKDIED